MVGRRPARLPARLATTLGCAALVLAACSGADSGADSAGVERQAAGPEADGPASTDGGAVGGAVGAGTGCVPIFPATPKAQPMYYGLNVELLNCTPRDIPLSLDFGALANTGTPVPAAGTATYKGVGVIWEAGDGKEPRTTPETKLPKGGNGATGRLVGFTTVPYWDGANDKSPGPYANYVKDKDTEKARMVESFRGSWAVYLPSSTIIAKVEPVWEVGTPSQYPYIPEFYDTTDTTAKPGAMASYLSVRRYNPGQLGMTPIVTKSSAEGRGESPRASEFVPNLCYQSEKLVSGLNQLRTETSNWSMPAQTEGESQTERWNFTAASNDFVPYTYSQVPVLLFPFGTLVTNGGAFNEIPLRDDRNTASSKLTRFLQLSVDDPLQRNCSGASNNWSYAAAIGASMDQINLSESPLKSAVFANSSLKGARMTAITMGSADRGAASLSYSDLGPAGAIATDLTGANLSDTSLIGTSLRGANLTGGSLARANLLNADLRGANLTNTSLTGALFCHTLMDSPGAAPGSGATIERNDNCSTVQKAREGWEGKNLPACGSTDCVFLSIYNNTTRTLSKGLDSCSLNGGRLEQTALVQPSPQLGPLDTTFVQFAATKPVNAEPGGDDPIRVDCQITYANGAQGKVTVKADTTTGSARASADGGTCFLATADLCLPKSANGYSPIDIRVDQPRLLPGGQTVVDVVLCEKNSGCSTNANLPLPATSGAPLAGPAPESPEVADEPQQ